VPLLRNIPSIGEILPYDAKALPRVLIENFDIMINLDLSIDALMLASLVKSKIKLGYWLDADKRNICFNKEAERWFNLSHNDVLKKGNKKTYQQHMMDVIGIGTKSPRDYKIPVNLSKNEKEFAKKFAEKHAIYHKQNKVSQKPLIIGLNTGGGTEWPKKEWPIEHAVELINLLCMKKSPYLFKILLFGGEKEKERNRKIVESVKFPHSLIDTGTSNTLRQFIALVNLCDIIVTADTLALHVALGLNKKVIALFGPTSAEEIEMYGLGKKIVSPIKCSVCYDRKCSKEPDCMDLVTPEKICKTITSL
jgi:heptosyltransferase-2